MESEWYDEFIRLARKNALEALQRLMEICRNAENDKEALAAAKIVLGIVTTKQALQVKDVAFDELSLDEQEEALVAAIQAVRSQRETMRTH